MISVTFFRKSVVSFIIMSALISMSFIASASAAERVCKSSMYCLEIGNIDGSQVADSLSFDVESFCRKWPEKAHNLHLIARAIHPSGLKDFVSRRLNPLGEGESQLKTITFKNLRPGKYTVTFTLRDTNNSAGKHVVTKVFVKK